MTPYPKAKDTPNRKSRKGSRLSVFLKNKKEAADKRRARRDLRRAAAAAAEEAAERAEAQAESSVEA